MKKKEWLKVQHEINVYNEEVFNKMASTYSSQRITINSKTFNVNNIQEEWPFLFNRNCFLQHANMLMQFDVEERWAKQLSLKIPRILKLFHSDKKKFQDLQPILDAVKEKNNENASKVAEECSLLLLLTKCFNEDENLILKYFEVSGNFLYKNFV